MKMKKTVYLIMALAMAALWLSRLPAGLPR